MKVKIECPECDEIVFVAFGEDCPRCGYPLWEGYDEGAVREMDGGVYGF